MLKKVGIVTGSSPEQLFLVGISALLVVASFACFAVHSLPALTFGHSLNYGEGVLLDQVRRIQLGEGLYPTFTEAPYLIDNYPPIYPFLASLIPSPEGSPFFGGRLLSVVATLISATMVALLVRRFSGDAAGLFCAAIFLCIPEVNRFAVFMRVDSLGLAFGLVGLYAILGPNRWWRLAGCAGFFFCCLE